MKKSLIALAVLAASGVTMAQSSVTLYGVADLSLAKATNESAKMSGNGRLNNGSSRLGVRGVEDLGGGLKASFNFEQGLNMENGNTDGVACTAALACSAATFQRAANLALSGGFGRFQMGRTLDPSFWGVATWELTGAANYSAVASQFGYNGNPTARANSMFMYSTPTMSGFSGTFGYVFKEDNVVAGVKRSLFDLNVKYANGPIAAALTYSKLQDAGKNWTLGGSYDFGGFKVAASFQDPDGAAKGFTLGGSVPVGAFNLVLDIARDTGSAVKSTDYVLEAKYALSKRTFAYGVVHRDGSAKVTTSGVGVRHNF